MNPTTVTVPVTSPLHPSHASWLEILLTALRAAVAIGPAVVAITNPSEAQLAMQLSSVASAALQSVPPPATS